MGVDGRASKRCVLSIETLKTRPWRPQCASFPRAIFEMVRANSIPPALPPPVRSAHESDGLFRHLSQWKPTRSTTWLIPPLTYGELPFLFACLHPHPHSSRILSLRPRAVDRSCPAHSQPAPPAPPPRASRPVRRAPTEARPKVDLDLSPPRKCSPDKVRSSL